MNHETTRPCDIDTNQVDHEFVFGTRQFDLFIENIIHPFILVEKNGDITNMNSAAREFLFSYNRRSIAPVFQMKNSQNFTGNEEEVQWDKKKKLSLCSLAPWIAKDFETFIRAGGAIERLSKEIHTVKGPAIYQISLSRAIINGGKDAGATIFINEKSNCVVKKCRYADGLNRLIRDIRIISHDLSQPIMVMNGYVDLIKTENDKKRLNCIFEQIKTIHRVHDRLREAIKHEISPRTDGKSKKHSRHECV